MANSCCARVHVARHNSMYLHMQVSPMWLCATLYLLMASVSVLIAAGMLMQQQLIWVLTGISYVDALKMSRAPAGTVRPVFARRSLG